MTAERGMKDKFAKEVCGDENDNIETNVVND
jgi:hypothetical protein